MKRFAAVLVFTASMLLSQTSSANKQIYGEVPGGTANGTNSTFTLSSTPAIANSLTLYRNGVRQTLGTDYTFAGNTITFLSNCIPQAGDVLTADYVTGANAVTLVAPNNLSDLSSVSTARTNLGLGTAATQNVTAFDPAGAASALLTTANTWSGTQTFGASALVSSSLGIGNSAPINSVDIGTVSTNSAQYVQLSTNGNPRNFAGIKFNGNGSVSSIQMDYWGSYASTTGAVGHGLNFLSGRTTNADDNFWFRNSGGSVVLGLVNSSYAATSLGPLATTHNMLVGGTLTAAGIITNVRSVTASDAAKTTDHTLVLTGTGITETLLTYPKTGQELFLVNTASTPATISGNGKSIWSAGTTAASITLAPNATAILQFDGTVWRQIS